MEVLKLLKIEVKVPYFLFQKIQSWLCWLWGLYHFYLACQEKWKITKPVTHVNPKIPQEKCYSWSKCRRICCQLSCNHWYYPVCETVCILWSLQNPEYVGKWGKWRWSTSRHQRMLLHTCAGEAVAVDTLMIGMYVLKTFIRGKYDPPTSIFDAVLSSFKRSCF